MPMPVDRACRVAGRTPLVAMSWTAPGRAGEAQTQASGGVGDDLHVDAVPLMFSGVVRLLIGDAVDRDHGAVEDRVGQPTDPGHGRSQVIGCGGEQGDRFADVAPGGRGADAEPGGQPGERVTVAQMRQREERLLAGVEATPVRTALAAVGADQVGEVVKGAVGQGDRRGEDSNEAPGGGIFLGRLLVLPGASPHPATGTLACSPPAQTQLEMVAGPM